MCYFWDMKSLENIKNIRIQKGLSQSKMAELLDISQTGYSKIEKGTYDNISLELAIKIANILGMPFDELFEIEAQINHLEIEGLKNKILDLEAGIELRDKIIADYSKMFDDNKDMFEFVKKFYSETSPIIQFFESVIDKSEGAPPEMKEEMKSLLHDHLNNTKPSK